MKQLEKIIQTIVAFSEKSRREGLLALYDEIEELDEDQFSILKHGMKLAVDGFDSRIIDTILTNMTESEKDEGELRLKTIQRTGVLCVQDGYNTRILAMTLLSFLHTGERRALENKLLKDDIVLDALCDDDDSEEEAEAEPERDMQPGEFIKQAAYILRIAYNFAQKARREGLLSLEDELEDLDEEFIKQGLRLVVDGTDSTIINTILSNEINLQKNELIKRLYLIQKEAVINIQSGINPDLLVHILISFLSNSELKEVTKILDGMEFFKENVFEDVNTLEKEGKKFTALAANILHRAYKFSEKASECAALSLSENIDQSKVSGRDIFEYGIQFAVNGIDMEIIGFILSNLADLEKNSEIKRAKIIQKEAVMGICGGENPAALFHVMLSFLNDEELEEVKKIFSAAEFAEKFNELLDIPSCSDEDFENIKKSYAEGLENSCGSMEVISFFNKPYDLLKDSDQNLVSELLKNEHPQTIASLLAWLYSDALIAGGVETITDILKFAARPVEKKIIACLEADDPELAEEIVNRLFTFDDIIRFDTETMCKIFREIDSQELAIALMGANEELQEKIFACMSMRAAAMLREDMEYMGTVRANRINKARRGIASIIRKMEDRGEISLSRSGN